jgi:hypothetical protein
MNAQVPPQNNTPNTVTTNQVPPAPAGKKPFSKLLKILLVLFIVGSLLSGGYYMGSANKNSNTTKTPSPSPTQTADHVFPSITKAPSDSGIPIKENTVSFTMVNGEVYMRYKGRIYNEKAANNNDPSQNVLPDPDNYTWYGLVDAPKIPEDMSGFDELFNFKMLPDKNNFIFIMRWPISTTNTAFNVYYYDAYKNGSKVIKLFSSSEDSDQEEYFVPRINKISPDGKYVAFNMYVCCNCGGLYPETMLYNLEAKQSKRIGKTSLFNWKEIGNYEYKEYKNITCNPPLEGPGECSEDPKILPLLTGKF